MRLSFRSSLRRSIPAPALRAAFEPPQVQAARIWVDDLRDGDHVYAALHAACETAINAPISRKWLPLLLHEAGFIKYRCGKRKSTMYRRGVDARPSGRRWAAAPSKTAPEIDGEAARLFARWTRQFACGVYTFAALRDSFMEWCVDGHIAPMPDITLAVLLKGAGFVRYRIGKHKLTIYEKPASAERLAAAA